MNNYVIVIMHVVIYEHVQAFTWFADAMVDHAETFWSLFGVDLSAVLEQQPPDTWDTFPIFQMLNNYLRNHGQSLPCEF